MEVQYDAMHCMRHAREAVDGRGEAPMQLDIGADPVAMGVRDASGGCVHNVGVNAESELQPAYAMTQGVHRALCLRRARAVRALCEQSAVFHHR